MTIGTIPGWFKSDGRIRGSFVYMLLCQDDGPIYVKVGRSIVPMSRLNQLRHGCPITPKYFYTAEVPVSRDAVKLEAELHHAFKIWHQTGEWYKLEKEDRDLFNTAWKEVFGAFAKPGWPMKWTKIAVQPLAELAAKRRGYFKHQYKRRGQAYRDFLKLSRD